MIYDEKIQGSLYRSDWTYPRQLLGGIHQPGMEIFHGGHSTSLGPGKMNRLVDHYLPGHNAIDDLRQRFATGKAMSRNLFADTDWPHAHA